MDVGFFNRKRNDRPKLAGVGMLSLKRKNPVEQQNEEVRDIPENNDNNNIMTDDENSDDEVVPIQKKTPQSSARNRMLTTISSDSAVTPENEIIEDSDRTRCSLLENIDKVSNEKRTSEVSEGTPSLFSDIDKSNFNGEFVNNRTNYPLNEDKNDAVRNKSMLEDTVAGSFTDQDLMFSRLSDLRIQENYQNKNKKSIPTLADTISSSFTDQDLMFSRLSELRIRGQTPNKQKESIPTLADTVLGSFTDDDLIFPELDKNQVQEHNVNKDRVSTVADTILESFTDADLIYTNSFVKEQRLSNDKQKLEARVVGNDKDTDDEGSNQNTSEVDDDNNEANDDDDSSSEEEVISVLDSDEEDAEPPLNKTSDSFVNCSNIPSNTSTLPDSIDKFFNNPPSIKSNEVAVSHTMIRDFRDIIPEIDEPLNVVETSIEDRFVRKSNSEEEDVVINESVEISETSDTESRIHRQDNNDSSCNVDNDHENDEHNESVQESNDRPSVESEIQIKSTQSDKKPKETLRIKGRINLEINFKIYQSSSSNSSFNDDDSPRSNKSSSSSEPSPPRARKNDQNSSVRSSAKATPTNSSVKTSTKKTGTASIGKSVPASRPAASSGKKLNTPVNTKKSLLKHTPNSTPKFETPVAALKAPQSGSKSSIKNPTKKKLNLPESDFVTPVKDVDIEIDEGMEEMLNALYGEEWKTPSLLQSCKSRKFQKAVRKSMALTNFGAFSRNLPKDLESTRISMAIEEKNAIVPVKVVSSPYFEKKQQKSDVKKVESEKKVGKTPKYHPICDTDTEDSDSSEDNFQPNETWNASCSDEHRDEDDDDDFVIKKRTLKTNINRKPPVFEQDAETISRNKEKEFDDMLDRFEYKKPQQIATPSTTVKTKRKLFTHTYYDLGKDESLEEVAKESENKENNVKTPNIWNQLYPLPNKKLEQVKSIDSGISSLLTPSTPKSIVKKTLKPSTSERVQTPKTASKVVDKFQKDRFSNYSFLKSLDVTLNKSLCHPEALLYRENFKSKKHELADKLYKLYNDKVFDNKLDVPVNWNKKLTNTAGRCNNSRRSGDRKSTIDLSDKVLTSADRLRCTLIHEMCHAATWINNGENGHGATWKSYAARAMNTFPELPKISTCHNYVIEYKYTYQCVNCKAKSNAHSKSKKVEDIQCSICHSKIELFLNKKNKDGIVTMTPVRKASGFAKFVQVKYKEIKTNGLTHAQVMQKLGSEFSGLSVEEKGQY